MYSRVKKKSLGEYSPQAPQSNYKVILEIKQRWLFRLS